VAVTSKEPTKVGFALLIFDAEMSNEVFVPLSFSVKLLTFIFADLIVGIIAGPQWSAAVPVVRILVIYGISIAITYDRIDSGHFS
jgi:hypothetical protein